ncbi:LysR family transcriptional regulator [Lentibacter algarum]|uniref:LysR substrate-binding domain-containing protein n=1 Tax=Lentibacter algarum TaxID=576131 RepID=UPI001C07C257|nr:LysR substrate-binding domain-containing protein [Lentibacter algarum]MBU2981934.1 LysR family transcriptional regulator [Lentibacter algarum]
MADHLPLNALRSFECAARCGGFVQAGKELGVSSAAVSLQVKNLETYYGKELFLRLGNKIFLTDAGESIYPDVAGALEQLSHTSEKLQRSRKRGQFVISVLPAMSEFWLLPRLAQISEGLEVSLDIRVEHDPIDFEQSGVDLRLTYDSRYYKEYYRFEILADVAVPTCSPEFWESYKNLGNTLSDVPARYFLHNRWGPAFASEPSWEDWFQSTGTPEGFADTAGFSFSDTSLVISAARRGLGVALAPRSFLKEDVEAGRLVVPSDIALPMTHSYVAICPHAKRQTKLTKKIFASLEPKPEKLDNL